MKFESGLETGQRGIDMIPLIDVVFLLLVFFIYAMLSMTVHRAVDIRLPKVSEADTLVEDYVSISVNENNELFLDGTPIDLEDIAPHLRLRVRADSDTPISIYGDSRSQLGTAVMVLDSLRRHGYDRVSLSVEKEERPD